MLAGYTILALALTYPVAANLFTQVPGGGDAWQHIWNLWWVKHALLDLHTNPYHTNLIFYPDGANLYLHTLVLTDGLIGIPLQLVGFNLVATYNILILLSFVLAGYGAYLLCHYLTRNVWASFVGGFVFAFAPYHFAHLLGHLNLTSLQWIPFYALLLLKTLDAPTNDNSPVLGLRPIQATRHSLLLAAGAGALLAVNAYTDWLYGIFLVLFTGLVVGWRIIMPSERRALRESGVAWASGALRLAVLGGVFLLLLAPVLFPTLAEAGKGYAQQPPEETLVYSADAILAFTPSEFHPVWGQAVSRKVGSIQPYLPMKNPSERVLFVGYAALGLALYGAWRLRKQRYARFWAFIALATWLLSLGPILQLFGKTHFTAFGVTVPLPYLLLYKLPLFSITRTPARLTVLTMLALAVLVAFALSHELRARPAPLPAATAPRWRYALFAFALPLVIAFEFLAVPFPTAPPGWGVPIYSKIAAEPGQFALLELPIRPMGDYMAYQTVHGKPIIGGYLSRQPPYPLVYETPALKYVLDDTAPSDPVRSEITGGKGIKELQDLGVKYVIIRWWAYLPEQKVAMQAKLDALLGRPPDFSYPADKVDVWQLSK